MPPATRPLRLPTHLLELPKMQRALFNGNGVNGASGFRDSAFARNKELPFHRWVPWIAGFSADFVKDCLDTYLPKAHRSRSWVLDPFAGVGTTLVEAYLNGRNVIGFEINPYAAMAARVKLEAARISPGTLSKQISDFKKFMQARTYRNGDFSPHSEPPQGFTGRTRLFSPKVERKVLFALDYINRISTPAYRDVFRLALGSTMISFSNYTYEPSLTRRVAVEKPEINDADVADVVCTKLEAMLADIRQLQHDKVESAVNLKAVVENESFLHANYRRRCFVDLAVTSPPYLNNYHYPRNTRPQINWLGFASGPGYSGAGEMKSFGKFWQTVRDLPAIGLDFELPELERVTAKIRTMNPEKGLYGGRGWANYVATYFNDTRRFCDVLLQLLKPGAVAMIVLGNSIIQGVEVKTDRFFGRIAELSGLLWEETILLRNKRTGSSIIQSSVRVDKAASRAVLYETGIVLRKPAGK
jgi:hypothetical protein